MSNKEHVTTKVREIIAKAELFCDTSIFIIDGVRKLNDSLQSYSIFIPKAEYINAMLDILDVHIFPAILEQQSLSGNELSVEPEDPSFALWSNNLLTVLGNKKTAQIKDEIIELFSKEKDYIIRFKLPNVTTTEPQEITITNLITLRCNGQENTNSGISLKDSLLTRAINPGNSLLINVKYSGYLSQLHYAKPYSTFKQIVFLAICFRAIKISEANYSIYQFMHNKNYQALCGLTIDGSTKETPIDISTTESNFLSRLHINDEEALTRLKQFSHLFGDNTGTNEQRILSALEWGFASEVIENETFSFIFKVIAIEALFGKGDKGKDKKDDLTQTLCDRLVYFLAKNHRERNNFTVDFKKAYNLRSQLIHGSQTYLDGDGKEMLLKVDRWLKSAIEKELEMLSSPN